MGRALEETYSLFIRRSEAYEHGRIAVVAWRVAASVVDRGGRGDPFRDLAPRRSRRSRQPLGLAVSGYGYAVHLQPPDLRALAAGALPDLAESPHCGVLAIHRGRTVYGSHLGSFRGGGARGADARHLGVLR